MTKEKGSKWYIEKEENGGIIYANKRDDIKITHDKDGRIALNCDISLEEMINQPEVFIEKGCLDACIALWDLNITTRESNGWEKDAYIVLGNLSDENMKIFKRLANTCKKSYEIQEDVKLGVPNTKISLTKLFKNQLGSKFGGCCVIRSRDGYIDPKLIEPFVLQDIYEGVYTTEAFLSTRRDAVSYVLRPDGNIERIVDITNLPKTIEEYVKEAGYIYVKEEDKVYKSQFYLDRHLKYLDHLKEKENKVSI